MNDDERELADATERVMTKAATLRQSYDGALATIRVHEHTIRLVSTERDAARSRIATLESENARTNEAGRLLVVALMKSTEESAQLRTELERTKPQWDATDDAHPCWWRGHDNGAAGMADLVSKLRADLAEAKIELESHANQEASWKELVDALRAARDAGARELHAKLQPVVLALGAENDRLRAELAREKAAHEKDLARASEITRGALADLDAARVDLARVTGELGDWAATAAKKGADLEEALQENKALWTKLDASIDARCNLEEAVRLLWEVGFTWQHCDDWCGSLHAPNGGSAEDQPWVGQRRYCTAECAKAEKRLYPKRTRVLDPHVYVFLERLASRPTPEPTKGPR